MESAEINLFYSFSIVLIGVLKMYSLVLLFLSFVRM